MIELQAGSVRATVDASRGARLSSLSVWGRELVVGPPDDVDASIYWGSFLMAPWPGRIEGGRFDWDGRRIDLPTNDEGHAIHGLALGPGWEVESQTSCSAALRLRLDPVLWPFDATVRQSFDLGPDHLTVRAELGGERRMPAALGWHPWFRRGDADPEVTLHAPEVLEMRDLIPTGRRTPVDAVTDLRAGPPVSDRALDHVYPDAAPPALVRWPDLELAIDFGPPLSTVVVHSREYAFCVEPQSAWPNAVALVAAGVPGTGLVGLGAGERLAAGMTWRWRRIAAGTGR